MNARMMRLGEYQQLVEAAGQRVGGSLYWKAYVLGKLGRRDDAVTEAARWRGQDPQTGPLFNLVIAAS